MPGLGLGRLSEISGGIEQAAKGMESIKPPVAPELGNFNMVANIAPESFAQELKTTPPTEAITKVADTPDQPSISSETHAPTGVPDASEKAETSERGNTPDSAQPKSEVAESDQEGEQEKAKEVSTPDETQAEEGQTEAKDNTTRTQELEDKVKNGEATSDEMRELRDIKKPEKRREDLQQKVLEGSATDDEINELGELNKLNENKQEAEELTQEQEAEKLQEDVEDLGTEIMTKLANGDEVDQKDIDRMRELRSQEQLINQGFTPKDAREAVQSALKREGKNGSERQSRKMKEVQDEIQELMGIELQILSLPETANALKEQREKAKEEARAKHREADNATGQDRLKKKAVEYQAYMKVATINAQIAGVRFMAPRLEARRQDLEQAVRRKLGVTGGFGAVMEWGAAKARVAITEISTGAAEDIYEEK